MNIKISKKDARKKINNFFKDIKNKTPKQVKKIKRLAMAKNIPLNEKRKMFCKKCFTPYTGKEKIRIKKGTRSITCSKCGFIARWKLI